MKDHELDSLLQSYRQSLDQEVRSPEVQARKRQLVERHFSRPAWGFFQPAFWVPALAMTLLAVFFLDLQFRLYPRPERAPRASLPQAPGASAPSAIEARTASAPAESEPVLSEPRAKVKRVSSRAGSALVYHKTIHDLPVTIVWVLPKGV